MMKVYLKYGEKDELTEFNRIRRKRWGEWHLLARGEWAESPCNQGENIVYISSTNDRRYRAIMWRGAPYRQIIAVAECLPGYLLEESAAAMMRKMNENGDSTGIIERYWHHGRSIDWEKFWFFFDNSVGSGLNYSN